MQAFSTATNIDVAGRAQPTAPARKWFTAEFWTWLLVGAGVLLRVTDYCDNRKMYTDEKLLLKNLVDLSVFDFHTILSHDQLAAPAYLVVERVLVRLPFDTVQSARFTSLLCGIASMFLMRWVARRYLLPFGFPIAVGLFAFNDWLVYYASELKQYSTDVALTLAAFLLAARPAEETLVMCRRRLLTLAAFGAAGVWFSHPLAFVLASVGSYLVASSMLRRQWKMVAQLCGVILLWICSFGVCFLISYRILSKGDFLWRWWGFAFLPLPPHSIADLKQDFWQIVNVFNNPSWVVMPIGVLASAFVALGLFLFGWAVNGFEVAWRRIRAGGPDILHDDRFGAATVSLSRTAALVSDSVGALTGGRRGGGDFASGWRDRRVCTRCLVARTTRRTCAVVSVCRETPPRRL